MLATNKRDHNNFAGEAGTVPGVVIAKRYSDACNADACDVSAHQVRQTYAPGQRGGIPVAPDSPADKRFLEHPAA